MGWGVCSGGKRVQHEWPAKCTGIITGHIHKPNLYTKNNILYANCGDFIESNTYIIEDLSGEIKLIEAWNEK